MHLSICLSVHLSAVCCLSNLLPISFYLSTFCPSHPLVTFICPSVRPSVPLSIHSFIHLPSIIPFITHHFISPFSVHLFHSSVYPSIHQFIISVHPNVQPLIHTSIHLSFYSFVSHPSIYQSVSLLMCRPSNLSVHPSIYLSICLYIHLSVFIHLFVIHVSIHSSVSLFIRLSILLCMYLNLFNHIHQHPGIAHGMNIIMSRHFTVNIIIIQHFYGIVGYLLCHLTTPDSESWSTVFRK